jgi:alpha-beta hydrolase superfamily lysophospholipase
VSNLGALVVHGLFEHEGRHKDNVEWLKNLGIETYSLNLPGHGDIAEKGHIETWDENIEAIVNAYSKISNKDIKIIFAHSYGSLVSVSAILRKKIDPDYLILSAPHFDDNYPKFVKNISGAMAKVFPKLRAPSSVTRKNLSTDKETVDNYFNDPLVFRSLTFKFGSEITIEQKFVNENIEKLKIPTLVLHGDQDKVVPIKASEEISKLENVKFITVENSKHEILNQDTRMYALSEIHKWFKEKKII